MYLYLFAKQLSKSVSHNSEMSLTIVLIAGVLNKLRDFNVYWKLILLYYILAQVEVTVHI